MKKYKILLVKKLRLSKLKSLKHAKYKELLEHSGLLFFSNFYTFLKEEPK